MGINEELQWPFTGGPGRLETEAKRAHFAKLEAVSESPIMAAIEKLQKLDDFWDERPILQHIRDSARALMAPPWAVLGVTLARVSCTIPYWVALPGIVGGGVSAVNIYTALAGPPSSGKTISLKASQSALPLLSEMNVSMEPWTVPLGTGEGVSAQFVQWHKEKGEDPELEFIRREVMFTVDEAEALEALRQRSGSTVGETLRRAWTGEMLGFANRAQETRLMVPAGEYRLSLIAGVQPATAMSVLSPKDFGTGLAQRFVWFDATDKNVPDITPDMPESIGWNPPVVTPSGKPSLSFEVAASIKKEIQDARRVSLKGEADPKEQHRNLNRLKVAAVLAWMDQRRNIAASDWELASTVMEHSDGLREKLIAEAKESKKRENFGKAKARISADDAVMMAQVEARVETLLKRKDEPKSKRELATNMSGPQREYLGAVLDDMLSEGKIGFAAEGKADRFRWI